MDIRQLVYFVTTVEEKTVTSAAEKLHMTQPPLTMQLHMLEDELGCKLFRRDGRTLSLTDAGQHFYSRALEIIGMCDSAKSEMNDYRSGNAGELRIGAISSVRGTLFTDWIKDYHDKYPYVKILHLNCIIIIHLLSIFNIRYKGKISSHSLLIFVGLYKKGGGNS